MTNNQPSKTCPFCGAKPTGIEFEEHPSGRAGYVLKIKHKDQCFIEHMSNAYYGTPEDCAAEWDRRDIE